MIDEIKDKKELIMVLKCINKFLYFLLKHDPDLIRAFRSDHPDEAEWLFGKNDARTTTQNH